LGSLSLDLGMRFKIWAITTNYKC